MLNRLNSTPAISVVMPAFNSERYIAEAINSVIEQTESNFEFIIIDDGSTDRTSAIIKQFASNDSRIRPIFNRVNYGVATALNIGVENAKSEIIARMDADDICLPNRFSIQLSIMRRRPEIVLLGSMVTIIDPDGDELYEMVNLFSHNDIDAQLMYSAEQLIYHPSVMLRRSAVQIVGGYDPDFQGTEDLDLFLKLSEIGRIENTKEILLKYREHFNKAGMTKANLQRREALRALRSARVRRNSDSPIDPKLLTSATHGEQLTEIDTYRKWGWWALSTGRNSTARKHALNVLIRSPLDLNALKLLGLSYRKRRPGAA
jgi:glycosyltransferase involved in cell wall biosynthesis